MPCIFGLLSLAVLVLMIVSAWKVFVKAGRAGWEGIIPYYNLYVLTVITGLEIIWFILTFIPLVQIVAGFKISITLAQKFGKGTGFGVGLALLPVIFLPILAFGDAKYFGAPASAAVPPVQQPPAAPQA